jgi:hypothetical protein
MTPQSEYRLLGKVFYRFTTRYKAWVAMLGLKHQTKAQKKFPLHFQIILKLR